MTSNDGKAELVLDDEHEPRRLALYEDGQLVEYFEKNAQADCYLGAIIAARITRIFASQRRAETKLPNGALASFRLGAKPYPKAGDITLLTLTAEPRQHKPWQAEQGISRAGRLVVLHAGQTGVRLSHKAKAGKQAVPQEIAAAIMNILPEGWGAVIKRNVLDNTDYDEALVSLITEEVKTLLAPLDKALQGGIITPTEPQYIYHGDDILMAGQLAASAASQSRIETDPQFWDETSDKLEFAYGPHITLENGIVITIEMTQALTAIDIDSGTSQLGPKEIARQSAKPIMRLIRLARLSGIVVVDMPRLPLADMEAVLSSMRKEARRDRRAPDILGVSRAGLIEIIIRHHYAPIR